PSGANPRAHLRIALQRDRGRVEGGRDAVLGEQPQESPHARSAAVLVDGLRAQIAILRVHHIRNLRQALVSLVAGSLRVLGPLLLVHADAHRDRGTVWPDHLRQPPPVPDVVAFWPRDVPINKSQQFSQPSNSPLACVPATPARCGFRATLVAI